MKTSCYFCSYQKTKLNYNIVKLAENYYDIRLTCCFWFCSRSLRSLDETISTISTNYSYFRLKIKNLLRLWEVVTFSYPVENVNSPLQKDNINPFFSECLYEKWDSPVFTSTLWPEIREWAPILTLRTNLTVNSVNRLLTVEKHRGNLKFSI